MIKSGKLDKYGKPIDGVTPKTWLDENPPIDDTANGFSESSTKRVAVADSPAEPSGDLVESAPKVKKQKHKADDDEEVDEEERKRRKAEKKAAKAAKAAAAAATAGDDTGAEPEEPPKKKKRKLGEE